MNYQIDIFDKETKELIHSITGCSSYGEAIKIAASFRDDNQYKRIRETAESEQPIRYITEAQSEYVLAKTGALLKKLEKGTKPSKKLQEAIDCIKWLCRWFYPIVKP